MGIVWKAVAGAILLGMVSHVYGGDPRTVLPTASNTFFSGTDIGVKMTVDTMTQLVTYTLVNGNGAAWVSLGPAPTKLMAGTYAYVCDAVNMKVVAYDITFNDFKGIALAPQQNFLVSNATVVNVNGMLACTFTRNATSGGSATDSNININANGQTFYTWAVSNNHAGLTMDIHDARGGIMSTVIDAAGTVQLTNLQLRTNPKVLSHAALMIIAWFYILPISTIIVRFYKSKTWWFKIHRFLNYFILVTVAASFIVIYTFEALKFIASIPHHVFGLLIIIALFFQAVLGGFKPVIKNFESRWKMFWEHAHQVNGYIVYLFAFINAMVGTMYIDNTSDRNAIISFSVIPFVLYLVVYAVLHRKSKGSQEQFDADFDYKIAKKMNDGKSGMLGKSGTMGLSGASGGSFGKSNPDIEENYGRFKNSADFDARYNK